MTSERAWRQPDDDPDDLDVGPADELHPDTPDVAALKRRVLLTGVLAFALWFGALALLDVLGLGPLFALLAAAIIYLMVVRPLMRPVRAAVRLRRRLAHQAWLDAREDGGGRHG